MLLAQKGSLDIQLEERPENLFFLAVSNSFKLSFFTGLIISVVYLFFFKDIISTLTNIEYLRFLSFGFVFWVILIPPIASFCYQFDGIFIGASQTAELRNSMIISVTLFILFSIYLIDNLGNHGLWLSLLFFMVIRALTLNFYFPKILRKF